MAAGRIVRRRCDRGSVEHGPSWSDLACYGALRTAGSGPHETTPRVHAPLLPDKSCKGARCGVRAESGHPRRRRRRREPSRRHRPVGGDDRHRVTPGRINNEAVVTYVVDDGHLVTTRHAWPSSSSRAASRCPAWQAVSVITCKTMSRRSSSRHSPNRSPGHQAGAVSARLAAMIALARAISSR